MKTILLKKRCILLLMFMAFCYNTTTYVQDSSKDALVTNGMPVQKVYGNDASINKHLIDYQVSHLVTGIYIKRLVADRNASLTKKDFHQIIHLS